MNNLRKDWLSKIGGNVAKVARDKLEKQLGETIVSLDIFKSINIKMLNYWMYQTNNSK